MFPVKYVLRAMRLKASCDQAQFEADLAKTKRQPHKLNQLKPTTNDDRKHQSGTQT